MIFIHVPPKTCVMLMTVRKGTSMPIDDGLFEQRFAESLLRRGKMPVPRLTPERKAALLAEVKAVRENTPALFLIWKRVAGTAGELLTTAKATGMQLVDSPAPVMRGEEGRKSCVESATLPLQCGELRIQAIADGSRRTRLLLSVKGECEQRDDLSVELSLGEDLLEARPLEKKAELTLDGIGEYRLDLFAGREEIATLRLPVGEETDNE